ncbi:Fatty acid desaturase [Nannocystis exedens]|uniref:Fatty acid desaturase n=1 Tax=Nannocystis exedens TaxID=54 RepID=A0A1I1XV38_9BACT|nr:fatty acid desaturase [Nannocystis exedens]PCC73255.1 Fatty acid desaturase [Nannocystis exedens]SFE09763.1 Fatty acid desaturase [Nannocystis exedens]
MRLFRHSRRDAGPVLAALTLGGLAVTIGPCLMEHGFWGMVSGACSFALVVWWTSNTVAHVHLHTPVFRSRALCRLLSLYLSALTLVPQAIWRARHLDHHRGTRSRLRLGLAGCVEVGVVAHVALALALVRRDMFFGAVLPGWLLGLGLCLLQGRGEHLDGQAAGISHYGRIYNLLWFNDGYHAEHHARPGAHWTTLPAVRSTGAASSARAPVLRGLSIADALVGLERLALRSQRLQTWLVERHAAALRRLQPALAGRPILRVVVIGGGLFPRSALALLQIWPEAQVTIIDADARHLERARELLRCREAGRRVEFVHRRYEPGTPLAADLVIVPLALVGDRDAVYAAGGPPRVVHEWIWRRRGAASAVVSRWLLKRVNLALP